MRADSSSFQSLNRARNSKPVLVVELSLNSANTELAYLTSRQVDDLPSGSGITEFQKCLISCSSTSQKLKVSDFTSTIGSIKASASDKGGITDYLRTQFGAGNTTSNNRFRMYAGFAGIAFSDFSLVQTQIVRSIEYDDGAINFSCLDVQRDTKKKIFKPKTTLLTANIDSAGTTLSVQSTSGFDLVWHGNSYTDAPSVDAGYIIARDGDRYEIMRWSAKTSNSFTIAERGAFGTIPQEWEALDQDGESNELEIEEFIYLELPFVKLAYAILTGNLYGDAGKSLPDHWNLGIDAQWISTAQFTSIGSDIWDVSDDSKGKVCRFFGVSDDDGRTFINKEIMPAIGCFMPISASGELGLRRIASVLSTSPYSALLTEENIVDISGINYAQDEVQNQMQIDWSWDFYREQFRRADLFRDSTSAVDKGYGWRDEKVLSLKGVHGDRHSRDFMRASFMSFRDRFGSEPIYCKAKLIPGLNVLEVADTVRLSLSNWEDYTDTGALNRTFEVQGVTIDWLAGNVSVDLFGSTQDRAPLPDDGDGYGAGYALEDSLITAIGTDIEAAFSGSVSRSGDLVTINSDITLTGAASLTNGDGTPNSSAWFYVDGDLLIASGVTVTINDNVIIAATGFVTTNGKIDGKGRGGAGQDYRNSYINQEFRGFDGSIIQLQGRGMDYVNASGSYQAAEAGAMHPSLAGQGGFAVRTSSPYRFFAWDTAPLAPPVYNWSSVPNFDLSHADLIGLPSTLIGGGGLAGGHIFNASSEADGASLAPLAHGSSGGNGGAGLCIISRGASFGASGEIDLSGDDAATDEQSYTVGSGSWEETFWAGRGCGGAPGCLVFVVDGGDSTAPLVDQTKFTANYGNGSNAHNKVSRVYSEWRFSLDGSTYLSGDNHSSWQDSVTEVVGGQSATSAYHRVQFIVPAIDAPGEETPADVIAPPVTSFTLNENTNTPQSPAGNLSTIDVNVTPPASTAYAYSRIYIRLQGATAWNRLEIAAETETTFTVTSNGATWEVQARSVSVSGVENESGPTDTITVTNKGASSAYALEIGYDENDETLLRVVDLNDSNAIVGSVSGVGGVAGKVVAGVGSSGYTNLADKPAALSDVNAIEGTKLSGIEAGADQTQTALDAEVTTTGGVILSTDGAVRTAGKSSISDSVAGVIIGDVGGVKVIQATDGGDNSLTFDGTNLVLGRGVKIIGAESADPESIYLNAYPGDFSGGETGDGAVAIVASNTVEAKVVSTRTEESSASLHFAPLQLESGTYLLDTNHAGDYRDFETIANLSESGGSDEVWAMVGIGTFGKSTAITPNHPAGGFGLAYDLSDDIWWAYVQDTTLTDKSFENATKYDVSGSMPANGTAFRLRITYTGSAARGGTDELRYYINGSLIHTFTGVGDIVMFGPPIASSVSTTVATSGSYLTMRLGQSRMFTANPAYIY
ncbi:MAG: hypothetical protein GY862_26855 [Gammaproteobacteria bacterium]|nr:hypothetical protein [Gammaproteobacteria bacterium]MCP5013813.1 hypothetical protein [Ketobacter sp.]